MSNFEKLLLKTRRQNAEIERKDTIFKSVR